MFDMLELFLKFARTKPADETYTYRDGRTCAVAQFAAHENMIDQYVGLRGEQHKVMEDSIFSECETYAAAKPHTFGALATRLERRVFADAMQVKTSFVITEEEPGVWSYTANGEHHIGYPDAFQASAAALRFFDPSLPKG